MKLLKVLVVVFLILPVVAQVKRSQPEEVSFESWQRGKETVINQIIRVTLGPQHSEYAAEITGDTSKRYKLSIIHNPISSVKTEHWKIALREITSTNGSKDVLGYNLLTAEGPGGGGDNFPREDFAAYLYPEKEPPKIWVGGTPLIEGHPFYALKATRKIRIEGFYMIIKVENFQFNSKDQHKLDFLDLMIEFQNAD